MTSISQQIKMYDKGYRYIMFDTSRKMEPLYVKTLDDTYTIKSQFKDKTFAIKEIE